MVQVSKAFGTSTHSAGMSRVTLAPCTWILLFPYVFLMDSSTGLIQLAPGSPGLTSVHSATGKALKTSCSRGQGTPCTNAKRTSWIVASLIWGEKGELFVAEPVGEPCGWVASQAHGDHHNEHGHGHPLGVMHATTTAPIEIEEKAKVKSGETFVFPAADRGGGLKGGGGVSGGGWGGGGGDGEGEGDEAGEGGSTEETGLAANKRRKDKIKGKVDKAIRKGKIPKECSKAYAELLKSPTMAFLCKNDGWRARLLGDINFMSKLWIELGTGTVAQALAEYQRRGKEFIRELDFVMADTLTSLFANFAAVWLSCPTVAVKALPRGASRAVSTSSLQRFFSSCPTNAFQTVTNSAATGMGASKGYTLYQRGGALLMPMPKLFAIGFGATLGGYGLIAALGTLRRKGRSSTGETGMEDVADQSGPTIPVFRSGLAIGSFLAVSTNLRYQFIAGGLEQRVFDKMRPGISSLASTAIRSGNLYFGSLTIVDWLRFLGLQSH